MEINRTILIHFLVQLIFAIVWTKGNIFLFPLALSEIPGISTFLFWVILNFITIWSMFRIHKMKTKKINLYLLIFYLLCGLLAGLFYLFTVIILKTYTSKPIELISYKNDILKISLIYSLLIFTGDTINRYLTKMENKKANENSPPKGFF
jgi:hypothetical protein